MPTIRASTSKGPVDAEDLEALASKLANLAPGVVTLLWGSERVDVAPPVLDTVASWCAIVRLVRL